MKMNLKSILRIGCAAVAWLTVASGALGATYHVDCGAVGENSAQGTGTELNPIRTLEQLNQVQLAPGARVLFKRGSVCYGTFRPAAGSSGAPGAPIVVDAYGPEALPRPVIAAGCRKSRSDPAQASTESAKTAGGISPYHSLCTYDNGPAVRAAIHLFNVQQWEINSLELSNDGLSDGPRVGLLVQLENFGTGSHYRINNLYVHHVRGFSNDTKGPVMFKETGGILFNITRGTDRSAVPVKTRFDDVLIENSEIYHVDAIGISNRSSWMCRTNGAPCADYLLPGETPAMLADPAVRAGIAYYASTRFVIRNNKIHDIGGDGIIVRTASAPRVESNLIYEGWMRVAGDSAGAWAINTDDALFQYNEVHGMRKRDKMGDGMAFDADLGTWNTVVRDNYSHDNEGGLMLFCGCGSDSMGNQGKAIGALVENNLSLNDGSRIITINGAEQGVVRGNLVVTNKPGLDVALIESNRYPGKNEVAFEGNQLIDAAGTGRLARLSHRPGSLADVRLSGNTMAGYSPEMEFAGEKLVQGPQSNTFNAAGPQDIERAVARWFAGSAFSKNRYRSGSR